MENQILDRHLMVGMFIGDYVRGYRMTNGLYLHHPTPCLITACKKISMLIETENVCAFPLSFILQLLRAYFHLDCIRYTLPLIMFLVKKNKKKTEIWIYFFMKSCLLSSHYRHKEGK